MLNQDRFVGTHYTYNKGSVAVLIPFMFAIPVGVLILYIYLLRAHAWIQAGILSQLSAPAKGLIGVLFLVGVFVAWDLWKTFRRVMTEEICVTSTEIVWLGDDKKVLLRAAHSEIQDVRLVGRDKERAWKYEIVTTKGKIRFTKSLQGSEELIERVRALLGTST